MKNEKEFYVIMQDIADPYLSYYLTHNLFYTSYDICDSFQDKCIFTADHLKEIKEYLDKDGKEYNYTYEIIEVEEEE